jgi:hypothetical protein
MGEGANLLMMVDEASTLSDKELALGTKKALAEIPKGWGPLQAALDDSSGGILCIDIKAFTAFIAF